MAFITISQPSPEPPAWYALYAAAERPDAVAQDALATMDRGADGGQQFSS
jgi:hypothetical protein